MDFGDILAQWEEVSKKESGRKNKDENVPRKRLANAPSFEVEGKNSTQTDVHKGKREPLSNENLPKANPMDVWLRRYGVIDKDVALERFQQQEQESDREYLKKLPPEATIDLHGLTRDEAWNKLDGFVRECSRRGLKKILIVHGKGNHCNACQGEPSVLSAMVRSFIESDKRLGASGHPDKRLGGTGATWVMIKKNT